MKISFASPGSSATDEKSEVLDFQKEPHVLVVDLDGALLRSDMLHESFWSVLGRNWRIPLNAAAALRHGRAHLKRRLAQAAVFDPALLPYNSNVIGYVERWRKVGGRAVLVTASDQTFADTIATHLGIFDEAHGSDGAVNLKGERKAEFLSRRFAEEGFSYLGDSWADLPVWKRAEKAITVNAPRDLRNKVERFSKDFEHLGAPNIPLRAYFQTLRPHHWLKNSLLLLPLLSAHDFSTQTIFWAALAYFSFNFIASGVYVINDLLDLSADRAHPRKKARPFASGTVPIAHGPWIASTVACLGLIIGIYLGTAFLLTLLLYIVITTAYSLRIKRYMVLDIFFLAGLYCVRIVAGGIATGVPLSMWLLTFAGFFFLSLAAVKRQAELVDSRKRSTLHLNGRGYQVDDLPVISMFAVGAGYVSVLVLALYVNSPSVVVLYNSPKILWGVCAVLLFWISRTVLVSHRGRMHDDPVIYALKDRTSLACCAIIFGFVLAGANV